MRTMEISQVKKSAKKLFRFRMGTFAEMTCSRSISGSGMRSVFIRECLHSLRISESTSGSGMSGNQEKPPHSGTGNDVCRSISGSGMRSI